MEELDENYQMTQEHFIDTLIERSNQYEKVIEESSGIQEKYEKYLKQRDERSFNELIEISVRVIWKDAYGRVCYWYYWPSDVNDELKQRMMIWINDLLKYLDKKGIVLENFGGYARYYIRWRIADWYRKEKSKRESADFNSIPDEIDDDQGENSFGDNEDLEKLERIFERLIIMYCHTLMTLNDYPQKQLALCYARILPHINFDIKYTKNTSVKWAVKRMGNDTIFVLTEKSENELKEKADVGLVWGEEYNAQTRKKEVIRGHEKILGEVVYTEDFSADDIENWARSMHRIVYNKLKKEEIKKDKDFYDLLCEYSECRSVLYALVYGEEKKR